MASPIYGIFGRGFTSYISTSESLLTRLYASSLRTFPGTIDTSPYNECTPGLPDYTPHYQPYTFPVGSPKYGLGFRQVHTPRIHDTSHAFSMVLNADNLLAEMGTLAARADWPRSDVYETRSLLIVHRETRWRSANNCCPT